jgi:hypothetical protein
MPEKLFNLKSIGLKSQLRTTKRIWPDSKLLFITFSVRTDMYDLLVDACMAVTSPLPTRALCMVCPYRPGWQMRMRPEDSNRQVTKIYGIENKHRTHHNGSGAGHGVLIILATWDSLRLGGL